MKWYLCFNTALEIKHSGLQRGWFFGLGFIYREVIMKGRFQKMNGGWSLIRVVSRQGVLSAGVLLYSVTLCNIPLTLPFISLLGWSLIRIVFLQGSYCTVLLCTTYHSPCPYQFISPEQRPYAANTQYAYNNWSPPAQSNETSNG